MGAGQYGGYKYGSGIGGGIGGSINSDPYSMGPIGQPHYRENSQGGQGSIGSSGSGMPKPAIGSRGSDFKLPQVTNKMAMGGMRNLPGMPGSRGAGVLPGSKGAGLNPSQGGINKPPRLGSNFQSNVGAGFSKGAPSGLGGAFNIPKYGSGGGIGGGIGLGSYGGSGLGAVGASVFDRPAIGSQQSQRSGSRNGLGSGLGGRHNL